VLRSNRGTQSQFSSCRMRRLNPDWVTLRSWAEREKLCVAAKLRKSSSHFNSMTASSLQIPAPRRRALISLQETRHLLAYGRFCRLSRSCVMFRISPRVGILELFRRAILLQQRPRQHMHLWAGCLTVTPGRRGSRQKY
jgi:hypothetical protein